jgi:mRNA-degrading endonuclease toxin of MazEF toxin-antitoxin module
VRSLVPDAGDIVWFTFHPLTGHERAGHRPAVVLGPAAYNEKTSLMVCCPMTTQIKYFPFEVVTAGASPSADSASSLLTASKVFPVGCLELNDPTSRNAIGRMSCGRQITSLPVAAGHRWASLSNTSSNKRPRFKGPYIPALKQGTGLYGPTGKIIDALA